MSLPFTAAQFFDVFARYNLAVWPMQVVLTGVIGTAVAARRPATSTRVSPGPTPLGWSRG